MAFNTQPAERNAESNDNWKAQGFLNLYLPSKDGGRRKLGAIGLKVAKPNEKAMLEWLNEDPSRVAKILEKLVIEYQSAEPSDKNSFDLD